MVERTLMVDGVGPVLVSASARRKKTVSVSRRDGQLTASVPASLSQRRANEAVADAVRSLLASIDRADVSSDSRLAARAAALAARFGLPTADQVVFVSGVTSFWGRCIPLEGRVEVNDRLRDMPGWVLDYVLVHELAHLRHDGHTPAFWALVRQYPRTERAIGYLMAMSQQLR